MPEIHEKAIHEFDRIQSAVRIERLQALKDRRFYSIAGAQWEGRLGSQFENKPKLEINKVHLSVIRIINEYRNNRITVDFHDRIGDHNDKLADVLDGLYRATEQDSWANEAYDNAFEEAVGGGYGAWRLRAVYEDEEDEDNEYQQIVIEPIVDADSTVFFDLGSKRQDKRDAKWCFVLSSMTPDDFEEKYPGESMASVNKSIHQHEFDWNTPDIVYVAEVYHIEKVEEEIFKYATITGNEEKYTKQDFENNPELKTELEAIETKFVSSKVVKRKKVHKYEMSGAGILKDCGLIAGDNIPIVMTYGKRWFVDNIERAMGHVRLSKDAQRLKNMQMSKLAEIASLSPVGKPILSPQQIKGHEVMWSEDNTKNFPYLLVNPTTDKDGAVTGVGPSAYLKAPEVPQPMALLLQSCEQDLKDLTGNAEEGEKTATNLSGRAVELIQTRLDMQTYIYMSNFARAIKHSGEIWLGMAKELFVEDKRKMRLIGRQNATSVIELNKPIIKPDGSMAYDNDISHANMTIAVDVGPSSSTKRSATVRALTSMMSLTQDPEIQSVLGSMSMMNIDGEGVEDVRDYFRQALIRKGVVKPTEKEKAILEEEMANQEPDPNTIYLKAAAEAEKAKAAKARADTILSLTKSENTSAKTFETLAGIDKGEQETAIKVLQILRNTQKASTQAATG